MKIEANDFMHQIRYDNAFSDWSEALPLGNGRFGAMGYLDREDGLVFTFNHYDLYYRSFYSQQALLGAGIPTRGTATPHPGREEMKRRAREAHADPNHPAHQNYNICFNPESATSWGVLREGSHALAIAGSLRLVPLKGVLDASAHSTALEIEKAQVRFSTPGFELRSYVAQGADVFVARAAQAEPGIFESLMLSVPMMRMHSAVPVRSGMAGDDIFFIENSCFPNHPDLGTLPWHYVIAVKLLGAKGKMTPCPGNDALRIELSRQSKNFTLLVAVIPPDEGADLAVVARRALDDAAARLNDLETAHRNYWNSFFGRSRVSLPDPMLETLWYLHLYSLASCSGEGSRLCAEACGLNGLWDIKGPSQWGSCWYWDVNIEQAYWPVFTGNHLELAKPFHKGLLAWADAARNHAREFYKLEGIAADYPFTYYLSIWAWCAQYFWWYYKYSGDESFLQETAYPLFKDILRFYEGYAEHDRETGELVIFPDVCPEQGPLTRNSMSTMSCLKYLLRMGIQSSEKLDRDADLRRKWQEMLKSCGEYAWDTSRRFGEYYKDSEWAEGLLFLAHSGILKPIYPIREISKRSPKEARARALGTLRYADALQAYGTHNIWPAAAAAVLGLGDEAVRMLYDRGIALMMSANGMFSEETERWMQNCLVNCHPVYNPPLMEAGSTVVATINEMLLQSHGGLIEVFPAIPVGAPTARYHDDLLNPPHPAPPPVSKWEECSFENLLAEGAFEVSAWLREGKPSGVRIKSLKGGAVRLVDPFPPEARLVVKSAGTQIPCERQDGIVAFPTTAGQTYEISTGTDIRTAAKETDATTPLVATAFTRRRVFLGKNRHTEFYRKLDGALLDFYPGHVPQSKLTVYKFDFTNPDLRKDYFKAVAWQWHVCGKQGGAFVPVSAESKYSRIAGRGWAGIETLAYADRGLPDDLRRDFVGSAAAAEFIVDLRAGQYQVVLVSGDQQEPTAISVSAPGGTAWESGPLAAGSFAVGTVLLNHARDGSASLRFNPAAPFSRWTLCALIINRIL